MPDQTIPYIERNPGDLITAEDWNTLQNKIQEDIQTTTEEAVKGVQNVKNAENAQTLVGQGIDDLTQHILEKILGIIPKKTGYLQVFKKLKVGEESEVEHNLKIHPLVDVYQLDYFKVVCSEDGYVYRDWVNFFLYHESEKRIRFSGDDELGKDSTESIEIEDSESVRPYRISFKEMLERYEVDYTDSSSLGSLETEFWSTLFSDPNDQFDDNQYSHSPWFDRCCREDKATVGSLKRKGDWDKLWFQMRPRKTVNYDYTLIGDGDPNNPDDDAERPAPTQLRVVHFDFDTLGVELLSNPIYPTELKGILIPGDSGDAGNREEPKLRDISDELKVMLLLKV